MIPHIFHLLGYTNSRWAPLWLPIWAPLKLQNPITFEPLSRFCSNLVDIGRYIYYMILHMFHLMGYTNSRWPSSWLPIWPPLNLQNPITFEPLSRFCSNLVDIGRYIYYMILHMIHSVGYTNSRWPLSWLPIWPPLKLQNPITFEPPCRFCSKSVDISIICSYICSICWVTQIQIIIIWNVNKTCQQNLSIGSKVLGFLSFDGNHDGGHLEFL